MTTTADQNSKQVDVVDSTMYLQMMILSAWPAQSKDREWD